MSYAEIGILTELQKLTLIGERIAAALERSYPPRRATEQEVVAKAGAALRRYKETHPEE